MAQHGTQSNTQSTWNNTESTWTIHRALGQCSDTAALIVDFVFRHQPPFHYNRARLTFHYNRSRKTLSDTLVWKQSERCLVCLVSATKKTKMVVMWCWQNHGMQLLLFINFTELYFHSQVLYNLHFEKILHVSIWKRKTHLMHIAQSRACWGTDFV